MELRVTFRNSIVSRCFASDRPWNARSAPLVTFPNILAKCAAFLISIRHIASLGFRACLVGFFYKLNVLPFSRAASFRDGGWNGLLAARRLWRAQECGDRLGLVADVPTLWPG